MKKLFAGILILMLGMFASIETYAQCPFGDKVNCEGACGRFTDEDGDSFCDFGLKEAPKAENKNVEQTTAESTEPIDSVRTTAKQDIRLLTGGTENGQESCFDDTSSFYIDLSGSKRSAFGGRF